jgi:hypothetical protein
MEVSDNFYCKHFNVRNYLKNKIRVQKQFELCEIPRIGGAKRLKSGVCQRLMADEHFETFRNTAMSTQIVFEIGSI